MRYRFPRLLLAPDPADGGSPAPDLGKSDPAPSPAAAVKGKKDPSQIGLEKKVAQLEDELSTFKKQTEDRWGVFDGFMKQPSPRPPAPGQPRKTFADELCDFLGFGDEGKA